ncbi:YiiD C-terminal domain-containing protein [Aestuariirhabdus sp. LZHN29]|uniref:YiiD C-terminal domain-containing protein n=1 Tax=Aestuariirhabdus sp. LZHN29 TaxID=3417462 RepID=UPI003CF10A1D
MTFSPEQTREFVEDKIAFVQRMGLRAERLDKGCVKLRAPLQGNQNHIGTMYAGALFTLAEIPGGALFMTSFDVSRFYPIVKEMKIEFLRPAKTDITCELSMAMEEIEELQAQANERGKVDYTLQAQLIDSDGVLVAQSCATYQLRRIGN